MNRRTHTIAFVVREHADLFYADPNLSRMAVGANALLSEQGYLMPLMLVDSDITATRVASLILGGSVDGAILVAMNTDDPLVTSLQSSQTPIVTASTPIENDSMTWVDTDNTGGTREATSALIASGRRRIGEIKGPAAAPVSALRHRGYVEAIGDAYDQSLVTSAEDWSMEAGAASMRELLARDSKPDALVIASDVLAAGAMAVLSEHGIRVPDDVAVIGFDDSPVAATTQPPLTTVHQDAIATGRIMATLLLGLLDGTQERGKHVVVPSTLVWRESAGPRRNA